MSVEGATVLTDLGVESDWTEARNSMHRLELARGRVSKSSILGVGALVGAVALLLGLGVLLNLNLGDLRASIARMQHSDEVLMQAAGLEKGLVDIESAVRGYILTGNPSFNDGFRRAQRGVTKTLLTLGKLVSDNGEQSQRIRDLRPLVQSRVDGLVQFAALVPSAVRELVISREPAAAEVRRTQYRVVGEIQRRLANFATAERELLLARQAREESVRRTLNEVALIIAALIPACGAAGIFLLIHERQNYRAREMRLQLIHAQRMSLMGETASMLAHEINQPLTAANNYLSALKRLASTTDAGGSRVTDVAERAIAQIRRASEIIQRLRNFIDKGERLREPEAPSTLIADAISLLGTLNTQVTLETEIATELPHIAVDRIQIQQVLVNLMRNAIEAMRASPEKQLFLSATNHVSGEVEFRLRDTGPGLPSRVAERLFQPFVSTKQKGMGIGLSICHRIIADHGGRIWAEAPSAGGTIFCFAIPEILSDAKKTSV